MALQVTLGTCFREPSYLFLSISWSYNIFSRVQLRDGKRGQPRPTDGHLRLKKSGRRYAEVLVWNWRDADAGRNGRGGAEASTQDQPFPGTLRNARYVYVASYDGDQFTPDLLLEDRNAIAAVQDSIQKWGKLSVVYRPADADIILLVQSRPSEDVLAVYDAHMPGGQYLWRAMGRDGLQTGETPLMTQFQKGFEGVQRKSGK